ncbi:MAG: DUF4347 domain-containing protein, partial [Desulfobacterales bacterium]|nr:DUF4347 domain-containing protein [Desulfobacterales bacterium]
MKRSKKIVRKLKAFSKKFSFGADTGQRKILFEALEKRLLLSGDPITASQDLQDNKDLLPDTITTLVENDNQSSESETQGADSPDTNAASLPVDEDTQHPDTNLKDSGNEPIKEDSVSSSDTLQNEPVTDTTATKSSFQLAQLLSKHSGPQLIFVDPSVPEYESLIDTFAAAGSDQEPQTQNLIEQEDVAYNTTDKNTGSKESKTEPFPGLNIDTDPAVDESLVSKTAESETNTYNNFEIVILDSNRDGLSQISETLAQHQGISAVHIISHGAAGMLRLGSKTINKEELDRYESSLASWQRAMSEGGDILLYGCNIADGNLGVEFVEKLSRLSGADVAASIDETGSESLGGNWVLEYSSGVIESTPLISASTLEGYGYILEDIVGTVDDDTLIGNDDQGDVITGGAGDDTYKFEDDWGSDTVVENIGEGTDTLDFSAVTTDLTFTINAYGNVSVTDGTNTITGVSNVEKIVGGTGHNTIEGPLSGGTWFLSGDNTVLVSGLSFSGIDNLSGSDNTERQSAY